MNRFAFWRVFRLSEGALHAPSVLRYSVVDYFQFDSEYLTPFRKDTSFSTEENKPVAPAISGLLFRCSPLTILWSVAEIIIFSFNRVLSRRPLSHVFKEIGERFSPSLAYTYSSPSVPMELVVALIATPFLHFVPRAIFRSFAGRWHGRTVRRDTKNFKISYEADHPTSPEE